MEDDDLDFTPTQSTSSNLASLFGSIKKPLQGNSSLTYTAPKAPKKESSPLKNEPAEEKNTKGVIICSKAVEAYKLENRAYISQGISGIVISGNYESHIYAIVLYKPSKEHLSKTTITKNFALTLSANNYVSFYDNSKQNWSVRFKSCEDVEEFVEKVAISKFYCHPESSENILIQDLMPSTNLRSYSNSTVAITYTSFQLDQKSLSIIKEGVKEKINLSKSSFPLAKGLVGCSENSKRIIIAPHSLSDTWLNDLGANKDLLLRIKVDKVISELQSSLMSSKLVEDGTESPVDSSNEETSIKSKESSLKQVLGNTKSQKANLISRMARMGQATLPLNKGLADGLSDSEEECSSASLKPKTTRNKLIGNSTHQVASSPLPQTAIPESGKQLSLYQNDMSWQQVQVAKYGMPQHQLISLSGSPALTPAADPNLSVFVSESRIQATELRMNIAKIAEKMDVVLNKIQNLNHTNSDYKMCQPAMQDSNGILSGIQSLIAENEKLKAKIEEQKGKLDQQNDRIFHLLELNQKSLEQKSTSHEKQSETELKLRREVEEYLKKEIKLEADNKKYLEKVKSLEEKLEKSEEAKKKMKEISDELTNELDNCKKHIEGNNNMKVVVEGYDEKLVKASEIIQKLKGKLKEVTIEKETLLSVIEAQNEKLEGSKTETEDLRKKNKDYERSIENLKNKNLADKSKYEFAIDNLKKSSQKLEEENKNLALEAEKSKQNQRNEIKKVLLQISSQLKESFFESQEYSRAMILLTIEKCFNNDINVINEKAVNKENSEIEPKKEFTPMPMARSSIQNLETSKKQMKDESVLRGEVEEANLVPEIESKQEKNDEKNEHKETVDDSRSEDKEYIRYKSYDQSWRTTKPPPPPLFDDEDDDDDWLN